ncbi:MAG: kelch repeat-containing protein [Myxococcaceae bacterium]
MTRVFLSALVLLAVSACAPKEVNYAVNIVTQSCDPASNPFEGVQFLRVKVTGDAMDPKTATSAANTQTPEIKIPQIPAGANRVIEVRAYDSDPGSGGKVISVGRSLPFDVPDVVPDELMGGSIKINVILRKVNAFVPIVSAAAATQCQTLRVNRAGHTATLLKNGKVFIAGGYNFKQGTAEKQALASTEIFNPGTGAFEVAKAVSITSQGSVYELPRAYHTATLLPSGQVMLWGGETYSGGANNAVSVISTILFYDSDVDDYGAIGPRTPAAIPRAHHKSAIDKNGKVLIVGGITRKSSIVPVDEVEWLDPTTNLYKIVDGVTLPRLDPVVMPVKGGEYVAVVGGTDGTAMKNDISFFKFAANTFGQQSLATPPRLADPGRRNAAGAVIRDGADLIVLGGYSTPSTSTIAPIASSEVLNAAAASIAPGPDVRTARGEICAVTLNDGTVLAIGGRTSDSGGPPRSDATVVLISASATGSVTSIGAPNLPKARYGHTCTALLDGSVLVTGGINETTAGNVEILQDAYIYTPAPTDD